MLIVLNVLDKLKARKSWEKIEIDCSEFILKNVRKNVMFLL